MKTILTIGAYDRDNFGDSLFYIILKSFLKNANLVPAGLAYHNSGAISDVVLPYSAFLKTDKIDTVWVVGGEVGGVSQKEALDMLIKEKYLDALKGYSKKHKDLHKQLYVPQYKESGLAYMPEDIGDRQYIVTSVGGLAGNGSHVKSELKQLGLLRQASKIWVRDKKSLKYLEQHGIKSVLGPDMVHSLPKVIGDLPVDSNLPQNKYITLQINAHTLHRFGTTAVARVLDKVIRAQSKGIVLLAAGTAPHHDSVELYEKIYKESREKKHIVVYKERSPLLLASCIVRSSCWVGTSLHGRVVAEAYNIPRISLTNAKTASYVKEWDNAWPWDIDFNILNETLNYALSKGVEKSTDLTDASFRLLSSAAREVVKTK